MFLLLWGRVESSLSQPCPIFSPRWMLNLYLTTFYNADRPECLKRMVTEKLPTNFVLHVDYG
jgi:hypothetical protein